MIEVFFTILLLHLFLFILPYQIIFQFLGTVTEICTLIQHHRRGIAMMKKMWNLILYFLIGTFMCFLYSFSVHAADPSPVKTVRVGWYKTAGIQNGNSPERIGGYNYEYLSKIAQYENWNLEFVFGTWNELEQQLIDGKIDILGDVGKTETRTALYDFCSFPNGYSRMLLLCRPDDVRYFYNDYSSFNNMLIGDENSQFQRDLMNQDAKKHHFTVHYKEFDSSANMLSALNHGEVDTVLLSNMSTYAGYKILSEGVSNPYYFIVSKHSDGILEELNDGMDQIQNSDMFLQERLFNKYFGKNGTASAIALTKEESDYLKTAEPVTVLVCKDQKPLSYEENDSLHGLIPDYLSLISEKTGLKFKYILCDHFSELKYRFMAGDAMAMAQFPDSYLSARSVNAYLTQPYYTIQYGMVNLPTQKKITSVAIETGQDEFKSILIQQGYTPVFYPQESDCLSAVASGKVAAAAVSSLFFEQQSYHARYSSLVFRSIPELNVDLCFAISKSSNNKIFTIMEKGMGVISDSSVSQLVLENSIFKPAYTFSDYIVMNVKLIIAFIFLFMLTLFSLLWYYRQSKMNQALRLAKQNADNANQAKSIFLSNMSHDLRTPLNGILGFTEIALQTQDTTEKQNCLHKIEISGNLLLALVNDTLDLSRIESGKTTPEPEWIDSYDLTNTVLISITQMANEKNVHLIADMSQFPHHLIYVDKLQIQKIVLNILSNAIKYTPSGGTVHFLVEALIPPVNGMTRRIIIEDTGIGMSPAFLDHLYEPFTQEHRPETANIQGTGLGLAIVKRLVDLMGGTIHVESKLNQGTKFTIELPLPFRDPEDQKIIHLKTDDFALYGKKILLCEDNPLNAEITCALLQKKGIETVVAQNGAEGFTLFSDSSIGAFDAILMDIRMPVMNGHEAAKAIRALDRPDAKTIPIIAMSADAFNENVQEAIENGMNAYLTKPVDTEMLYRKLWETIEKDKK